MLLDAFVVNNPVFTGTTAEFVVKFRPGTGGNASKTGGDVRILTCSASICGTANYEEATGDTPEIEQMHQAKGSWFSLGMLSVPKEQNVKRIFETDQLILLTDQVIDQDHAVEFTCYLPETLPPTHRLASECYAQYTLSVSFSVIDSKGSFQSGQAEMPLNIRSHQSVMESSETAKQTLQLKTRPRTEAKDIAKTLQTDVLELIDQYLIEDSLSPATRAESTPSYESKIYKLEQNQELLAQIQLASPTVTAGRIISGMLEFKVPCHSAHFVLLANDEEQICAQSFSTVGQQKIGFSLPVPSYACQSFEAGGQKISYCISTTLFLASEEYHTCKQIDKTSKHSDEQYSAKPSVHWA